MSDLTSAQLFKLRDSIFAQLQRTALKWYIQMSDQAPRRPPGDPIFKFFFLERDIPPVQIIRIVARVQSERRTLSRWPNCIDRVFRHELEIFD